MASAISMADTPAGTKTLLEKRCSENNAAACFELAKLYDGRSADKADYPKALEYYRTACRLKSAEACTNAAIEYIHKKDYRNATLYYGKACRLKDATGCYGLGLSYLQGLSVEKDYKKSLDYFTFACDEGEAIGCSGQRTRISLRIWPGGPQKLRKSDGNVH